MKEQNSVIKEFPLEKGVKARSRWSSTKNWAIYLIIAYLSVTSFLSALYLTDSHLVVKVEQR